MHQRTSLDHARDELMSHIHRCGVLKASPDQQSQWLEETMDFMAERYADLNEEQLGELHDIGRRFCQPVIPHGVGHSALTVADEDTAQEASEADAQVAAEVVAEDEAEVEQDSEGEMVGAA